MDEEEYVFPVFSKAEALPEPEIIPAPLAKRNQHARVDPLTQTDEDLTPLEDRFLSELVCDPKITAGEALRRAGSTLKNLDSAASRMLSKPLVRIALMARRRDLQTAMKLDALDVARKVRDLAFSEVPDIFDEMGNLLPMGEWPADARASVASIQFDNPTICEGPDGNLIAKPRIKSVKFVDKPKMVEMLIRLLGIQAAKMGEQEDDGENTGTQTLKIGEINIVF